MPLRRAHYLVLAMVLATVVAFWPTYFAVLRTARTELHFHGVTATAWMLLLALQSWTIHHQRRGAHRIFGIVSLFLFPLFLAGSVAVLLSMARNTPSDPFYQINGGRLGILDAWTPILLMVLFYFALKERRKVQLHARYMLATALPLVEPIIERLLGHLIPPFTAFDPAQFAWTMRAAELGGLVAAACLYAAAPRYGRPFFIVGLAMVAQAVLVETLGESSVWQTVFVGLGKLPSLPVLVVATIVGGLTVWAGWTAGPAARRHKPAAA
ncbi:hypothetical protein EWH08_17710 [Sphingobium indicum]|jgi:hypothetical protein|uniref:Uncharacterized protein n=2 Tax=Sphingomonadaceae TaxID=41297 RepID=A0A4Q4IXQ1_9SPHN|nr:MULTISPECIES: hypothetical protein [Sphingomonadaceae]EJU13447.1 hypothetical protein LH128_08691 [Sphingomonas sp. LH128]NYI24623.1 hypothetical protein [Sphingobium indicum]RYL98428.1 hypothetical protein EWH08_17710 [Sphingobium indicum]BBF72473.1 hypothetical protein SBA_pBAR3_0400 [Sphingomonas bisphenolicum]